MTEGKIKPTMTALQLSREAKEANGDCWYENKPVFIRTTDGELHRALEFTWDAAVDGFVVAAEVAPAAPPLPAEPPNGTVLSDGFNAIIRCDDQNNPGEGAWFMTGDKQTWCWDEVAPTITPDYRRYVPDSAVDSPDRQVLEAALAWVAYVHAASSPPNAWGDDHDFKLIEAVDAYNAAAPLATKEDHDAHR